jgi:hypothetical protein
MNHNYLAATNCAFGVQASPASFLLFPRAAWECGTGRAAPRIPKTLIVTRGAARLDCIPTQRVGTRLQ